MALFSMKLENLHQLFVEELRDLYDAENQITEALPEMIDGAQSPDLMAALQEHLDVTRGQISRLDRIFNMLNEKATGKTCKGMKGVLKEGSDLLSQGGDPATIDAGIIKSAQHVEHYEIAGYGTARRYAQQMGHNEIAQLLEQTLAEETQADKALTQIAESVNLEAKAA